MSSVAGRGTFSAAVTGTTQSATHPQPPPDEHSLPADHTTSGSLFARLAAPPELLLNLNICTIKAWYWKSISALQNCSFDCISRKLAELIKFSSPHQSYQFTLLVYFSCWKTWVELGAFYSLASFKSFPIIVYHELVNINWTKDLRENLGKNIFWHIYFPSNNLISLWERQLSLGFYRETPAATWVCCGQGVAHAIKKKNQRQINKQGIGVIRRTISFSLSELVSKKLTCAALSCPSMRQVTAVIWYLWQSNCWNKS